MPEPKRIENNNILWYLKSDRKQITGQDLYEYYLEILKDSNGSEDYAKNVVLDHLEQHLFKNGASKLLKELLKDKTQEFEKELQKNQPNLMTTISSESLNSVDSARSTDSTNSQIEIIELQSYYKEFDSIGNDLDKLQEFENKIQNKINDLKTQIQIYELSIQKIQTKKANTFFVNKLKKQEHATTIDQLIETRDNVKNKITQYEMLLSQIEDKMSTSFDLVPMRENHFNQRSHVVEDAAQMLKPFFQNLEEHYVLLFTHLQLNFQQSKGSSLPGLIKELDDLKLTMINTYQNQQYKIVSSVNCAKMVEVLTIYVDIFELYINLLKTNNTISEVVKTMLLTHCQDFIELIESERKLFSDDDCLQRKWLGFNMFDIIIGEIVVPYLKSYLKTPDEFRALSLELQEKKTFLTTMKTHSDLNFNALKYVNDLNKSNVYVSSTSNEKLNRRFEKSNSIQLFKKKLSKGPSMFNIFSPKPSDDEDKQEELELEIDKLKDELKFQKNLRELIQRFESQQNPKSFLSQGGGTKRRRRKRTRKNNQTHKKKFIRKSKKIRRNNYV